MVKIKCFILISNKKDKQLVALNSLIPVPPFAYPTNKSYISECPSLKYNKFPLSSRFRNAAINIRVYFKHNRETLLINPHNLTHLILHLRSRYFRIFLSVFNCAMAEHLTHSFERDSVA